MNNHCSPFYCFHYLIYLCIYRSNSFSESFEIYFYKNNGLNFLIKIKRRRNFTYESWLSREKFVKHTDCLLYCPYDITRRDLIEIF